jgi:hypothetical protein
VPRVLGAKRRFTAHAIGGKCYKSGVMAFSGLAVGIGALVACRDGVAR